MKRKEFENKEEFENACKCQRPNFDPETELHQETALATTMAYLPAAPNRKQKVFFSIFKKENAKITKETNPEPSPILNQKKTKMNSRFLPAGQTLVNGQRGKSKIHPPRETLSRPLQVSSSQ